MGSADESQKLVTVAKCLQFWEAEILSERLRNAGILAFVQGAEANLNLSYVGTALGGVRVQVPESELEVARRVIQEDEQQRQTAGAWRCPRCGEPNEASFDFCYSCSKARDTSGARDSSSDGVDEPTLDANPYRSPAIVDETVAREEAKAPIFEVGNVDFAMAKHWLDYGKRAVIIGMILPFPPLHVLSIYCTVRARRVGAQKISELRWTLYWVELLNTFMLTAWVLILLWLFAGESW